MGSADIFAVLFEKIDLDKDKFVLSAGWKAALLYFHLWRKGRITLEELDSYCQQEVKSCEACMGRGFTITNTLTLDNPAICVDCAVCSGLKTVLVPSKFIGLAEPIHPDIPLAGGSMGLGLPGAVGLALAKKIKGEPGTVYVLMSDGELQCGTTWESALIAAQHKLDNLVVIVDNNGFQAMGKNKDILQTNFPVLAGWDEFEADGHNHSELHINLGMATVRGPEGYLGAPKLIVAHTTKGKGVSFMENNNLYHYKQLSQEEYLQAKMELTGMSRANAWTHTVVTEAVKESKKELNASNNHNRRSGEDGVLADSGPQAHHAGSGIEVGS